MAKDAVTVTIDRHLHDWIKEKGGNKSGVINNLLHKIWINEGKKPKRPHRSLMRNSSSAGKLEHEKRLERMWNEMGYTSDGSLTLCCDSRSCICGVMGE